MAALHNVIAYRKRLNNSQCPGGYPAPAEDSFDRHGDILGKCSLPLNTHRFVIHAGIHKAVFAGIAGTAVEIRIADYGHTRL